MKGVVASLVAPDPFVPEERVWCLLTSITCVWHNYSCCQSDCGDANQQHSWNFHYGFNEAPTISLLVPATAKLSPTHVALALGNEIIPV